MSLKFKVASEQFIQLDSRGYLFWWMKAHHAEGEWIAVSRESHQQIHLMDDKIWQKKILRFFNYIYW